MAGEIVRSFAVVIALVVVGELAFRAVVPTLSANSRTLAVAPERASRIAASETPTALILGNSISGDGLNAALLVERLQSAGLTVAVEHQPADTTVMRDWYYQLSNQFIRVGAAPDWLILPVGDAYPLTRVNQRTEDLLFSFLRWGDIPSFIRLAEVKGFEERAAVVVAKSSALYGFRGRLQKRALVTVAPGYEMLRLAMREVGAGVGGEDEVSSSELWARLLADLARENGVSVVVVAMPTEPLEGVLPDGDHALAIELGWRVIEPAREHEFRPEERPDGLHLTPEARDRFTALLADALGPVLRDADPADRR